MDLAFRIQTSTRSWTRFWEEQSLGMFFHDRFNIDHFTSPHFTLTSDNHYYELVIRIWNNSFFRQGESLTKSKKFILRLWNDVIYEINRLGSTGVANSILLERIADSIIMCRKLPEGSSIEENHFLKAMVEAAREDNRLVQLVNIVNVFATGARRTQENYMPYILRQFIESSGLEENMIQDLLYRHGLQDEDLALRPQRQSDPADAGTHL